MKDKKIIRNSQHSFTKGRSCLNSLIKFYDEMTGLVEEGRAVDVFYLYFINTFDTVCCKILLDKLLVYGMHEQTLRWTETWLNGQAQRVVISGTASSWRPETGAVPQESGLVPVCFNTFINDFMLGQSILSASLQMTQYQEEWLILPSRGILTGWRNRLIRTLRSSKRWCAKSCTGGGKTPCSYICWGPPCWKAAQQKRTWRSW